MLRSDQRRQISGDDINFWQPRISLEPVLERIEVREPREAEKLQRHRGTEKFQPVTGRCKSLGDRDDF